MGIDDNRTDRVGAAKQLLAARPLKCCSLLTAVAVLGLWWQSVTHAEPFIPESDARILERLVITGDSVTRELRRLRGALAEDPDNLELAVFLARRYLEIGRTEADPRYYGYIQAALRPWWDQPRPPPEVLLLRATLRQNRHDFEGALQDLAGAIKLQPHNAQAWLTQAVIYSVRGDYASALRSCLPLLKLASDLLTTTCISGAASLNGRAEKSYQLLRQTLENSPSVSVEERLWALTVLAEVAVRLGWHQRAERRFKQALRLGKRDIYLLSAYADFLLDQNRPEAVRALLKDDTRADALLLRLVLAEQRLDSPQLQNHVEALQARIDAARWRGGMTHLGSAARFTLHLLNKPAEALQLARQNWRQQHEPRDALLVLETALAAGQPEAAQSVLDWLAEVGLEDVRLSELTRRLEEISG